MVGEEGWRRPAPAGSLWGGIFVWRQHPDEAEKKGGTAETIPACGGDDPVPWGAGFRFQWVEGDDDGQSRQDATQR
jgi:hypothetical protein